jgi:hypothetical protein
VGAICLTEYNRGERVSLFNASGFFGGAATLGGFVGLVLDLTVASFQAALRRRGKWVHAFEGEPIMGGEKMKRLAIALLAVGLVSVAHAADLPTTKAPEEKPKPNCWASLPRTRSPRQAYAHAASRHTLALPDLGLSSDMMVESS